MDGEGESGSSRLHNRSARAPQGVSPLKGAAAFPGARGARFCASCTFSAYTTAISLLLLLTHFLHFFLVPLHDGGGGGGAPPPPSFSSSSAAAAAAAAAAGGGSGGAAPPFSLPLTVHNTAYQMILVGPPIRQQLAVISALKLRATDYERDIILQVKEPLTPPLMEALEQLRVTVKQMPFAPMVQMEYDFGQCCGHFWACWMKLLTWRETRYRAVMNIDTDFLVLKNMSRAFDLMAANAHGPFDVGGVADPVVGASHRDSAQFDVFNGGMFIALPSEEGYEKIVAHAHGGKWMWGEMLWLNTFATRYGHWVRLPTTFNLFPTLIQSGSPYLTYAAPNWNSIYGLHFAGVSKAWPDTTREQCLQRAELDCLDCCFMWVAAADSLRALLAANEAIAGGDPEAAAHAERKLTELLPPGWAAPAAAVARRNAKRGFTFDATAYHDGYTGGTWAERVKREVVEKAARTPAEKERVAAAEALAAGETRREIENALKVMRRQKTINNEDLAKRVAEETANVEAAKMKREAEEQQQAPPPPPPPPPPSQQSQEQQKGGGKGEKQPPPPAEEPPKQPPPPAAEQPPAAGKKRDGDGKTAKLLDYKVRLCRARAK
jgi:hypothetical protein